MLQAIMSKQPDYNNLSDRILVASALLHDFADHKYDSSGVLKYAMRKWLTSMDPECAESILLITDNISFSKEHKALLSIQAKPESEEARMYWLSLFNNPGLELIRHIISDEDKKLALGKTGLIRCIEYTLPRINKNLNTSEKIDQLLLDVTIHYNEKLMILPLYFRTLPGKIAAAGLLAELGRELTRFTYHPTEYLCGHGIKIPDTVSSKVSRSRKRV